MLVDVLVVIGDQCAVKRTTPSSQTGDYEGDCLRIALPPDGNAADFPHGADFKVISQEVVGQDRRLLVARGESMLGWLHPYFGGCGSSLSGCPRKVMASSVVVAGTNRMGWTYGMLALPFKYFGHDKSFSTAVSLGPYVGRRFSTAGSAVTLAGAAALGSVQGEVRDAAGTVTGTPELTSFSWAAGVMWDISKNSGTRPFKMGVFYGKDYVSEDSAATYKHNRKSWLAFQIGFDFTDN